MAMAKVMMRFVVGGELPEASCECDHHYTTTIKVVFTTSIYYCSKVVMMRLDVEGSYQRRHVSA